jgi:hypothetical protein
VTDMPIRYQGLRHDHTARVQQGSRANGSCMDSGQAITIAQRRLSTPVSPQRTRIDDSC